MVEWKVSGNTVTILGSNDLRDWMFNFMTGRTIGDNERVNRWDRYEALVVLRAIRGVENVIVRGHSRGGAIAQIVAWELLRQGRLVAMILHGSKRTGNRRFVDHLFYSGEVTLHYRNRGDWIPTLPPWYADMPEVMTDEPWRPVWIAHTQY